MNVTYGNTLWTSLNGLHSGSKFMIHLILEHILCCNYYVVLNVHFFLPTKLVLKLTSGFWL